MPEAARPGNTESSVGRTPGRLFLALKAVQKARASLAKLDGAP